MKYTLKYLATSFPFKIIDLIVYEKILAKTTNFWNT